MTFTNEIIKRNNVKSFGKGETTLLLAHGFGCDQNMWRFITPELSKHYRIVLFDYVGSGKSDLASYNAKRYTTLEGYAEDISEICEALELEDVTLIGHSVSGMISLIASLATPTYFSRQIMICPSPCFLNLPPDYFGGFEKSDLEELLNLMDKNYIGWANYLAPLVMGTNHSTELIGELSGSFCSTDPVVAKNFARATFFSDYRHILPQTTHPTLILQSKIDSLASTSVGEYLHEKMPNSEISIIDAQGHCLHMTSPEIIIDHILHYVV